jgi:hypothetical protein
MYSSNDTWFKDDGLGIWRRHISWKVKVPLLVKVLRFKRLLAIHPLPNHMDTWQAYCNASNSRANLWDWLLTCLNWVVAMIYA